MAKKRKKTAKKSAAKRKKTKVSTARKKAPVRKAKKPAAKKTNKKAKKAKRARKAKPKTIGDRVASAFEAVTETLREAKALRDKMEPPASSETQ